MHNYIGIVFLVAFRYRVFSALSRHRRAFPTQVVSLSFDHTSYIYIYYTYLRRGGTKASACFLTRAGARETPPHPYGMAQT